MTIKALNPVARLSRAMAFGTRLAASRFPISVVLIVVFAAYWNLSVADVHSASQDDLPRLTMALYGAIAASVLATLAAESHGWTSLPSRMVMPAAAAAALGIVIWIAPTFWITAPTLTVALTLAIPLAPYVARPDARRFWTFTLWTAVGVTLAFVSVLLFTLGVSAILEMVRFLFNVGPGGRAYTHIYVTAATLVGPLFALGSVPRGYDDVLATDADDKLAAGVRFLFDWVAVPLALATALVLHLYAAKMLFLGELPKNEIGWIVTFYAVLVLALRIAAEPFLLGGTASTRLFGRIWASILVVPVTLLVYAAFLRIRSEGFTLERYYLSLGALSAGLVILFQAVPRVRGDIRWIAGTPLALLMLSCFGPWSAADTVGRSQTSALQVALREAGGGGLPTDMDETTRGALRSRVYALQTVGQTGRLLALLPTEERQRLAAADRSFDISGDVVAALGLLPPLIETPPVTMTSNQDPAVDAAGYDLIIMERLVYPGSGTPTPDSTTDAAMSLDDGRLALTYRGITDHVPLRPTLAAMRPTTGDGDASTVPPVIADLRSVGGRAVRLRLRQASFDATTGVPSFIGVSVLLRGDEWKSAGGTPPSLGGDGKAGIAEPGGAIGESPR